MSEAIWSRAVRGARAAVSRVEAKVHEAARKLGNDREVRLPNTGYFLPVSYGLLGHRVEKLGDLAPILGKCRGLLPPPSDALKGESLRDALDAGLATLLAFELEEALKYAGASPYAAGEEPVEGNLWLGAADDVTMRKRGVEFVDGSAPGFAIVLGAAPDSATAARIARGFQGKGIYVFSASAHEGTTLAEQLFQEGAQLGWPTRLVPFGEDTSAVVHAAGFAVRAALAFGGLKPGHLAGIAQYARNRIFAFVVALGEVTDEWCAVAAGAMNFGFPTIADSDVPEILEGPACPYEHLVANVSHDRLVAKAIETRGLKIPILKIDIPVTHASAFEGERISREAMHAELGGPQSQGFEFCSTLPLGEVEDGKFVIVGPDLSDMTPGSVHPLGLWVEVAGRAMQPEFEPILERQFHHLLNGAEGVLHLGQRDVVWMRVAKKTAKAGLSLRHFGAILHAKLHNQFGKILDKVQVTVVTDLEEVGRRLALARSAYREREARTGAMTDETTETFYSCGLCQFFANDHVCVVTPEVPGMCGAFNWLDCKAAHEITPEGVNQPIAKGDVLDENLGQWSGVNEFVAKNSNGVANAVSLYSLMQEPVTACGCFEALAVLLPMAAAVMIVDRDFRGEMTPCGMPFSTLAGTVGGGARSPGFLGMSKVTLGSKKFIAAEGGIGRVAWMPKALKESLKDVLLRRGAEVGAPDLYHKVATEEDATTEEEVLEFMQRVGHPALDMAPLL